MRVSIYKRENGQLDVLVEASVGRGLGPVVIQDVTPRDIKEKVLPTIQAMRRKRPAQGATDF